MEHPDEGIRAHLRLGALHEVVRARADLDRARAAHHADRGLHQVLEQVERELDSYRESSRSFFRRRSSDGLSELLCFERLVLEQLGFDSYQEYLVWAEAERLLGHSDDRAYEEFAELELQMAEERLDRIERGEIDLEWGGRDLTAVTAAAPPEATSDPVPLEPWHNPYPTVTRPPARRRRYARLPRLDMGRLSLLDLPYTDDAVDETLERADDGPVDPVPMSPASSGDPDDVIILDAEGLAEPVLVLDGASIPPPRRAVPVVLVPLGGGDDQTEDSSATIGRQCSRWAGSCLHAMVPK